MGYIVDIDSIRNVQALFLKNDSDVPVPDYDLTELEQQLHDDAIARLNLVNPNHRYMAFGFITDLHESYDGVDYGGPLITSKPSLKLLSAIAKTYNLDGVFFGGDYSLGDGLSYERYDAALKDLSDRVNASFTVPHFATEGNHDRWKSGNANNHCRGNTAWKRFLTGFNTPNMAVFPTRNDSENGYIANTYYVDFSKYKVRVVMRSAYEQQEKRGIPVGDSVGAGHFQNNLEDCLTFDNPNTAKNWTALCISHYSWYEYGKNGNPSLNKFFNGALNNGIAGKAVVGELFGHVHFLSSSIHTMDETTGTLVRVGQTNAFAKDLVSSGNSSYVNDDYRFSLYVIDTNSFNLHEIKVGVQYNRTGNPYYNSNTRIFSYPFRHNEPIQSNNTFRFLHFSDPHTDTDSVVKCKQLMEENPDIKFTILTGDYANLGQQNYFNAGMNSALTDFNTNESPNELLLMNGNHEGWDISITVGNQVNTHSTEYGVRKFGEYLNDMMKNASVNWGSVFANNNIASLDGMPGVDYYYIDYPIENGGKLRVICVSPYEYWYPKSQDKNINLSSVLQWKPAYSQKQIDWVISCLVGRNAGSDTINSKTVVLPAIEPLAPDDFVIIAVHEPPITSNDVLVNGTHNLIGSLDINNFCSSALKSGSDLPLNAEVLPLIMNGYLHRGNVNVTNIKNYETDAYGVGVVHDFRDVSPCRFLGYLCGHLHGDLHTAHPVYKDQLIMCIDWSNDTTSQGAFWSDIFGNRKDGVLINDVTIDFGANFDDPKITINRIGNGSGEDGYPKPSSGVPRDTITFSFNGETWVTE